MARFRILAGSHDHHGQIYKAGDVVESSTDLVKVFPNKFKRVSAEETTPTAEPPTIQPSVPPERTKVPSTPPVPVGQPQARIQPPPPPTTKGRNVTKRFPRAVDEDFKVFSKGGLFWVYDNDKPESPVNSEGLEAEDVDGFIGKALED